MRRTTVLAFVVALVPLAWLIARFNFLCDDAYIAFRYSKNFAEGLGLRFNVGSEPPVEGYTQLGWVLFGAGIERLGLDLPVWSRVTTVLAAAALLFVLLRLVAERLELGLVPTLVAGLFLGTFAPFAVWATGGLETMCFALALFVCFERLLGDPDDPHPLAAGLAAVLAAVLRADGLYWLGAILALGCAWGLASRRPRLVRDSLSCAAAVLVTTAAHYLWRHSYYGEWLPNTAVAKVGLSGKTLTRGALYLANYWLSFPAVLLITALGAWSAVRSRRPLVRLALALVAATFAYGVLVGGDFMCMGRFFTPAVPFLGILLAYWVHDLERHSRPVAILASTVLIATTVPAAFNRFLVPESLRAATHFRWTSERYVTEYEQWQGMKSRALTWGRLGKALKLHVAPDASLVRGAIGAAGYYSGLVLYDQHGLVDREVARHPVPRDQRSTPGHDRFVEPSFFLDRKPTYLGAYLLAPGAKLRKPVPGGTPKRMPVHELDGEPVELDLVVIRNDALTAPGERP